LSPRLIQTKHSLKKLRSRLKKIKRQRKDIRNQQTQLLDELSESVSSTKKTTHISSPAAEKALQGNSESVAEVLIENEKNAVKQALTISATESPTQIVRIPITGPNTNRVEVYLQQDQEGHWLAGHFWSVEADARTGQFSRGSKQPDQKQATYSTEMQALMNEVLNLSQGIIGVIEIENQIIDYLNQLEEYPGQIAICCTCHHHYIKHEIDQSDVCSDCSTESDA